MGVSKKSIYRPSNPQKYKGNVNNIICRSNWERQFCVWCDKTDAILEWGSEEFFIPYLSPVDRRVHRYFPDFYLKYRDKNDNIRKLLAEVKPKKYTKGLRCTVFCCIFVVERKNRFYENYLLE